MRSDALAVAPPSDFLPGSATLELEPRVTNANIVRARTQTARTSRRLRSLGGQPRHGQGERRLVDQTRSELNRIVVGLNQRRDILPTTGPLQITGLNTDWRRPRYVFGIDGVQVLHLAMKSAAAVLESPKPELDWLGERGNLGMPKFLPDVPKAEQARLEAIVEREAINFWRSVERAHKRKTSKKSKGRSGRKPLTGREHAFGR